MENKPELTGNVTGDVKITFTAKELLQDIWLDIKEIKGTLSNKADKHDLEKIEHRVKELEIITARAEEVTRYKRWMYSGIGIAILAIVFNTVVAIIQTVF